MAAMLDRIRNKLVISGRRLLARRIGRGFARADDGAAAIEFALVATPFLALIFAILETALVFFAGQTLESAATEAGRLIMTGQAQTQGFSQAAFKNAVCNDLSGGLFDCTNGVYVDVETYTSFSAINSAPPIKNGQLDTTNMGYTPGGPGDIVVVRLYYQWPIYLSLLNNGLANLGNGSRLLVATAVFRNEPYGS
jgi:Flp pilus assembly protein TadG